MDKKEGVKSVYRDALTELQERSSAAEVSELLKQNATLEELDLDRQEPEAFTRQHVVSKLLDVLELPYDREVKVGNDTADFRVTGVEKFIVGEAKRIEQFQPAKEQLEGYLRDKITEYGIATDGIVWGLYEVEKEGGIELCPIERFDLRDVLRKVAEEEGYYARVSTKDVDQKLEEYIQEFSYERFLERFGGDLPESQEEIKTYRKEFYREYEELLFEGDDPLMDSVFSPGDSDKNRALFCVCLIDRLSFIKTLQQRGVFQQDFIVSKLSRDITESGLETKIGDNFRGGSTVYSLKISSVFDALSTPRSERQELSEDVQDLPYLGDYLFSPIVRNEESYDISDQGLKRAIFFVENNGSIICADAMTSSLYSRYSEVMGTNPIGSSKQLISDIYQGQFEYVEANLQTTLLKWMENK